MRKNPPLGTPLRRALIIGLDTADRTGHDRCLGVVKALSEGPLMICPLCHKPHEDPPDVAGGRVRVCEACHTPKTARKQRERSRKKTVRKPPSEPAPPEE